MNFNKITSDAQDVEKFICGNNSLWPKIQQDILSYDNDEFKFYGLTSINIKRFHKVPLPPHIQNYGLPFTTEIYKIRLYSPHALHNNYYSHETKTQISVSPNNIKIFEVFFNQQRNIRGILFP